MRLRNLLRSLAMCLALFIVSANAATVAIAHVIYEGDSLYYSDSEVDLKFKSLNKGRDGTYTIKFDNERLDDGKDKVRRLHFGLECKEKKADCKTYINADEANQPLLADLFPKYDQTLKDQPIYDVWLRLTDAGSLEILPEIPEEYVIPDSVTKVIRLLPSWSNTTAILVIGSKEHKMTPIRGDSTYCGWFETSVKFVPKYAYVYFKQTIGNMFVGNSGSTKEEILDEDEILLDSVLKTNSDTIWILAKQPGVTELFTEFPDEKGNCPVKKLPVMMFDWKDGNASQKCARDRKPDLTTDACGTGTSLDFGNWGCNQLTKGMVEETLGPNGVPVRSRNFPENCINAEHLNYWFIPEDIPGTPYTNATCRDVTLELDDKGFWVAQKDDESPEGGFFLLDDFKYLDKKNTVLNPYYDEVDGNKDDKGDSIHNFGFSMKIQAQFEYVKGQKFTFNGDDDVWVFINNKLVVDIGGQHHKAEASINLDELGLVEGEIYPFHIFYAERMRTQSNFKMRTSIDLQSEASMFLTDASSDPKLIVKDVWQIVKKTTLACDFSASPETRDTTSGPSTFTLYGKALGKSGIGLKILDSLYYSGISVSDSFTKLTIDLKAIGKQRELPPGKYYVRVALREDPEQYKDIYFTVDPYELPNLAFASVKDSAYCVANISENAVEGVEDSTCYTQYWRAFGDSANRNISSDTLPISLDKTEKMWAGRSYPVNVMYAEDWANIYSGIAVSISSSDPNLIACDSLGNIIDEVILVGGHASFYVKGLDNVVSGTLILKSAGAKNGSISWTNINIAVPPVPQIETAFIYDRNGDGRGDSIWIHFKKALGGQSVLDSIKFTFGSKFEKPYKAKYNDGDDIATVTADGNFGTAIFTGGATSPYSGLLTVFYTYTDDTGIVSYFPVEGSLNDAIGPVIIAAAVDYLNDGSTLLKLSFSEGVDNANAAIDLFSFHCWKNKALETIVKTPGNIGTEPANQWNLIFKGGDQDVIPSVGDSVRFAPPSMGGQAIDLVGTLTHENNPWVRITGKPKVTITSPKVVSLDPASDNFQTALEIIKSESHTVPKLVVSEQPMNAEQVAAVYGTQGHYLGTLDMAELVENQIADIVKAVQETPLYYDKKELEGGAGLDSLTATSHTIEEIIADVSSGKISIGEAKDRFGVSDVIVDAYKSGLLTKENLASYSSGSEADIKNIVSSVADKTVLTYQTYYFTSLGHYVSGQSGSISCNDDIYKDGGRQNCLGSDGKLFLAWNMRADNGRLAATGVYIARLEYRVSVNGKEIAAKTQDFLWGVRRGQVNAIDLGL